MEKYMDQKNFAILFLISIIIEQNHTDNIIIKVLSGCYMIAFLIYAIYFIIYTLKNRKNNK
ncbi:hypothetical protein ACQW5G_00065 [Fructilactobacillus sp. Tb1]|uniref:hypothetical protein n=1 Tax=Fructilactobacillus sp. Tb1 TaxID=3422304 RepID=UPI003D2A3498